ncbi:MAG: hypothetical protein OEV00_05945 [Acidobacteriota bacterium]|nr:hypothetical protein [Acidobacteriota bacterium]
MKGMSRVLWVVIVGFLASPLWASSGGIGGFSGDPVNAASGDNCNQCHSGGIAPTVVIGGPTSVMPGSTTRYILQISGGQGGLLGAGGGLDVSTNDGTLIASDPGTYITNFLGVDDITHSGTRGVVGGVVTFSFDWQAPVAPGTYTIYGSGNSVDGAQGNNGDLATSTTIDITVLGAANAPGESSGPALAQLQVVDYDKGTGELDLSFDSACGTDDNNLYFGPLSQVSTAGYSGSTCDIGTGGSFSTFNPGAGSFFFFVVGGNGSDDGSYGKDSTLTERVPYVGNVCGNVQSLDPACVDP